MNFQFQLRNYKKNGTQAIRLRFFTSANDIQYIDTGVSVVKNQWDEKKQHVKKHPLEELLNASINALLNQVKLTYYKTRVCRQKDYCRYTRTPRNTIAPH